MTKLLVVEDSPTQAEELALLLRAEGFDVEMARDGLTGFQRCTTSAIDVVLSDIMMPGLDGYQLCKKLKAQKETSHIPVVLLTTLGDPMDIVRGLECGADNFITKPYDAGYLLSRLRRLLENRTLRTGRTASAGVDVMLLGRKFTINSDKEQMLDLLISTFEEMLRSRQREYEARLSEETLRESHRFLQSALDALSAQIAIVEEPGNITAVNASWRRFAEDHSWTWPQAGVGSDYLEVWKAALGPDAETIAKVEEGLRSARSGTITTFSTEYQTRMSGTPRWFTLSATKFRERGAHLLAVEHQEVTARKQLEQQFHHAQKMEAIGQLAGGVAHDFNNLLVVIRSYAELLLEEFPGDDIRRGDVREIIHASGAAASLTRQLLAFSRQQVLQPTVLDLNVVVAELQKMLNRLIGENIEYIAKLDPYAGRVKADAGQMQQVLMNLVVNARDAMPDGGTLIVETSNIDFVEPHPGLHADIPAGRYVALTVTDSGEGMSPDTQARIFEPFYTTKEVGKGTGLGLSTVYGIVQQSDGHIWVYSELGIGTAFKIYLPRVDQPLEVARRSGSSAAPRAKAEVVLVVEDSDAVRGVIGRVLRRAGYTVLEASGAEEALALANQHAGPIHLLISDVVMPKKSGPELARELKQVRGGMKVLFMSGYSGSALKLHKELEDGAMFLEKPFTPNSIAKWVREALDTVEA